MAEMNEYREAFNVLDMMLDYLLEGQTLNKMADLNYKYFQLLKQKGFSDEAALKIVSEQELYKK